MPSDRISSNQTTIHHDVETPEPLVFGKKEGQLEIVEGDKDEQRILDEAQNRIDSLRIDRIEAQIRAAARDVVASIEEDEGYPREESELSARTDDSQSQFTYGEGTELTYDGTEADYETEDEQHDNVNEDQHQEEVEREGDNSSHHDGDIDDDVFSNSTHSKRSSLNSCSDPNSGSDGGRGKELTSPAVGEEAGQPISRIPSASSYTPRDATPVTPSRVMSRPPFRTPSSVRAMQMGSPTPSIFSSPRSAKRHLPTVSRIGTPSSNSPSKRTPTRFKAKKEYPLVLLHVTVMPLSWTYSHVINAPDLPLELQGVKDNWRLLQHKLADTVLERGILLPHPQDSYEILEERLLEALELPVRPRVRILKCGHYMGPETPSSDEEGRDQYFAGEERKWCDMCGREVRLEGIVDGTGEKRFRIKIYASNGLMGAGSWAAVWRDMERVDVELEPYVESDLAVDLEHMASRTHIPTTEHENDGFVDVEDTVESLEKEAAALEEESRQREEETRRREKEAADHEAQEAEIRRQVMEEERMREIYGHQDAPPVTQPPRQHQAKPVNDDSLSDLLIAAFKVAMRDQKNVAIGILSFLVLILAMWPSRTVVVDRIIPAPVIQEAVRMESMAAQLPISQVSPVPAMVTPTVIVEVAPEAPVQKVAPIIEVQATPPVEPIAAPPVPKTVSGRLEISDVKYKAPPPEHPSSDTAVPAGVEVGPSDLKPDAISRVV